MVMRVTLALRGTGATRGQACLERRELRVRVRVGLAAEDAPSVNARVGAIKAEPHAASQLGDIGLGEARVGADRARRRARGALVDARRKRRDVGDEFTPMRSEDLFDAHVLSFGWMRFFQTIAAPARRNGFGGAHACSSRMSTAVALPSHLTASGAWAGSVAVGAIPGA
jgi:hypothetical protein